MAATVYVKTNVAFFRIMACHLPLKGRIKVGMGKALSFEVEGVLGIVGFFSPDDSEMR